MAEIREAEPAEVERVLGMYEWLFAPPGSVPPRWDPERARQAIAGAIADSDVVVLVAEHRGELLGLCTAYLELCSVRFGPRCWVEDLAVSPAHPVTGSGEGAARCGQGLGARARGDAPRARQRGLPRGRPPLLRAGGSELALGVLCLGA